MMSRGYITLAQNSGDVDYVRQAYALALSIKNTQSEVNEFAICVNKKSDVPKKWRHVFDYIIKIPGEDDAEGKEWKIHNKWKYFEMSPFDETVILDADMIFTSDVSHWWTYLSMSHVHFTTQVHNYKGAIATDNFYRKALFENELPSVYTAFMYFDKSDEAKEMFDMAKIIYQNWETFYYEYIPLYRPKHVSGDVVFSLAQHILGTENALADTYPSFVHMKSKMMDIPAGHITENWIENLPTYFTEDGTLKVGNYKQTLPVHYHIKEWLTDTVIEKLEGIYNGQ